MSKRFTLDNAAALVAHLQASGLDPAAAVAAPSRHLDNGCLSGGCCMQHPGVRADGTPVVDVRTHVSGTRLHKLALSLGLPIKP